MTQELSYAASLGQQACRGEVVESGQELAAGQVAGRSNYDYVLGRWRIKAHSVFTAWPPNSLRRAAIILIAKESS